MSERDYAPLSAACVRALHEKMYDKRKTAALEIEKMVKDFAANGNMGQIVRILKILGHDFATSQNPHARKGGLIGLAAVAIALGKDSGQYTDELIKPIIACFSDADLRVRYYACESLYNVVKVARGAVLTHFTAIFNALSKIATDSEQNVKNASELLDRLMKDIVTESSHFDLEGFMPLLRERMLTKSSFARQFVISWISVLDAVPDINLIIYLPELLDGLFKILDDSVPEVKKMCDTVLGEFLRSIKANPSKVDFASMINTLIVHAQDRNDDMVQFTAITWIKEFVQLSGHMMLPHLSGIFEAVLPCLAYDSDARRTTDIKETATAVNFTLMKLVSIQNDEAGIRQTGENQTYEQLKLRPVVDVLTQYLMHNSVQTKVAVLKWIHHLHLNMPEEMYGFIDILFPALQRTLSDTDEVVQQCLAVIAEVISSSSANKNSGDISNTYYSKFMVSLLHSFKMDKSLLEDKGSFIIRQLCVLLNAEDIYLTLAGILIEETDLKFCSIMVEHLNMILLTSSELYDLRSKLKDYKTDESCQLFIKLYKTWCHNPVATVALCLLAHHYKHSCSLIKLFGNLEVTVDFLMDIDKLIQLIESPIFAYLRLELLDEPQPHSLIQTLYGLLMLLPQSDAFHTLKARLSCIPPVSERREEGAEIAAFNNRKQDASMKIDFRSLLQHFSNIQEQHMQHKKKMRTKELQNNDHPNEQ